MAYRIVALVLAAAALAAGPARADGDADKGRKVFARCAVCHAVEADAPKKLGPPLHGLFGRKAGSVPGYSYSTAVQNAGFVWDEAKLDQWLAKPNAFLPGNKMSFVGIPKDDERADVIAYLKAATK